MLYVKQPEEVCEASCSFGASWRQQVGPSQLFYSIAANCPPDFSPHGFCPGRFHNPLYGGSTSKLDSTHWLARPDKQLLH